MRKALFSRLALVGMLVAACLSMCSCSNKAKVTLQTELNKDGFALVSPANTYYKVGALATFDPKNPKQGISWYGLPSGLTPATLPASANWAQQTIDPTFNLGVLVSGLKAVTNAGVDLNYNSNVGLKEIDASASVFADSSWPNTQVSDASSSIAKQIHVWIDTDHLRVFFVNKIVTVQNLNVTASGNLSFSAVFNQAQQDPSCPTSSSGNNAAGSSGTPTTTAGASGGSGTSGGVASPSGGSNSQLASSNSVPSGKLQVCYGNNSTFSLSAPTPVVFAASFSEVVENGGPGGSLQVLPSPTPGPTGMANEVVREGTRKDGNTPHDLVPVGSWLKSQPPKPWPSTK